MTPVKASLTEKHSELSDHSTPSESQLVSPDVFLRHPSFHRDDESGWARKVGKISRKIVKSDKMAGKLAVLKEANVEIVTSVHELQKLQIDSTLEKEKKMKVAKNIDLRKRKALADLFKTLQGFGLSYKKGQVVWKDGSALDVMRLPPLDPNSDLDESSQKSSKYFTRCVFRYAQLKLALATPSKDLGVDNVARCAGFSAHLYAKITKQRIALSDFYDRFLSAKKLVNHFARVCGDFKDGDSFVLPRQDEAKVVLEGLTGLVEMTLQSLEQFIVVLHACPQQETGAFWRPEIRSKTVYRGGGQWNEIDAEVKSVVVEVKTLLRSLNAFDRSSLVILPSDLETMTNVAGKLLASVTTIRSIKVRFEESEMTNTLTESLSFVVENVEVKVGSLCERMESLGGAEHESCSADVLQRVDGLQKLVLLALQGVYLRNKSDQGENDEAIVADICLKSSTAAKKLAISGFESAMMDILGHFVGNSGCRFSSDSVRQVFLYIF